MTRTAICISLFLALVGAALCAGCGGRSRSGDMPELTAPAGTNGTLRLTSLTDNAVVTVDETQAAAASGALELQLTPGKHTVSVSRTGYTVDNAAELDEVTVRVGQVTEHAVTFSAEAPPLPQDWVVE